MMEKEVIKIIKKLFEPVNESLELLKTIDNKLDIQASSKLRGQLETLELLTSSKKKDQTSFKICLVNLNESTEYYKSLTDQAIKDYRGIYGKHKLKHFLSGALKSYLKLGRKAAQKPVLCFARVLDYSCLWCLSEAGAIICLAKLKFDSKIIEERERRLADAFVNVCDLIEDQAGEMAILASVLDSLTYKDRLPKNKKRPYTLSDRLAVKMVPYLLGKNTAFSLLTGFANLKALMPLMPDCSQYPELEDLKYSLPDVHIANNAFEYDLESRWRNFLAASKQR